MKKMVLFFLLIGKISLSQDCNIYNEKDPFTKKENWIDAVTLSKSPKLSMNMWTYDHLEYHVGLVYISKDVIYVESGSEVLIMHKDSSVSKFEVVKDDISEVISADYIKSYIKFMMDRDQVIELSGKPIIAIRFYSADGNIDVEVKEKGALEATTMLHCFLKMR